MKQSEMENSEDCLHDFHISLPCGNITEFCNCQLCYSDLEFLATYYARINSLLAESLLVSRLPARLELIRHIDSPIL